MGKLSSVVLAVMPWMIIVLLLGAALFIKPQSFGEAVTPSAREGRDRFYGIAVPEPKHIWLAGNNGKVVLSTDLGKTWLIQKTSTPLHLQDVAAWDVNKAVAVGNDGIVLVTEDGGAHWELAEAPKSEVFNKLIRVMAIAEGRAIAVGAMGAILISDDFGRHWRRLRAEEDVAWNDVGVNGDIFWVVGEFGRLLKSMDDGVTWQEITSPVESSLTGIEFRDSLNGVVVGLEGVILTTSDGGESWELQEKITEEHLFDVAGSANGWLAVGNKNIALVSAGSTGVWQAKRLSGQDLAWHTEVTRVDKKFYITGASVGIYDRTQWLKL